MDFEEMLWSLAERAYEAYRADANGQSYNGRVIPIWDDVNPKIKRHWYAAVRAITRQDEPDTTQAVNEALNRRAQ